MKISVSDYASFQRTCAEMGPLGSVFYDIGFPPSSVVVGALALTVSRDAYIQGAFPINDRPITSTFVTDFPGSVDASGVTGSF